jgi:hypothetical protein
MKGETYRDPWELAVEELEWIIENHHPEQLDERVQTEIAKLLISADRELGL